jgi:hypothetical protein
MDNDRQETGEATELSRLMIDPIDPAANHVTVR